MARLFAIGDIHGYPETLKALIEKIEARPEDTIVFLGDYVDRGPNSLEVIDYLIELQEAGYRTIFLAGNHEDMLISVLEADGLISLAENATVKSIVPIRNFLNPPSCCYRSTVLEYFSRGNGQCRVPEAHQRFFSYLLPYHIERGENWEIVFVHAGFSKEALCQKTLLDAIRQSEKEMSITCRSQLLWERETLDISPCFPALIVHGHSPVSNLAARYQRLSLERKVSRSFIELATAAARDEIPRINAGKLNLDTGMAGGRRLTAVEFVGGWKNKIHVFQQENIG